MECVGTGSPNRTSPVLNFTFSLLPPGNVRVSVPPLSARVTRTGSSMLSLSEPGFIVTSTTRTLSFTRMSVSDTLGVLADFDLTAFLLFFISMSSFFDCAASDSRAWRCGSRRAWQIDMSRTARHCIGRQQARPASLQARSACAEMRAHPQQCLGRYLRRSAPTPQRRAQRPKRLLRRSQRPIPGLPLRPPGPHSLGFEAIEPDGNFAGNVG